MNIALYTLTSPLHDEAAVDSVSREFISELEAKTGRKFDFKGSDFKDYGSGGLDLIFVRTGGTEGLFKKLLPQLKGQIHILTSGKSNSLAASLEIISYLNQQGRCGEILHGSTEYIAGKIELLYKVASARKILDGQNLGIIGQPSDWLISSNADKDAVKSILGVNLVDIPIEELTEEFGKADLQILKNNGRIDEVRSEITQNISKYEEGALKIYVALKALIEKYKLSGLTLRCFDLLDRIGNTGCLALAMINAEGIPSGCEGDIPALLTMAIGNAITGSCGFQSNPSRIDPMTGELLLAHCTVPFDMVRKFSLATHFESGIGIAVHGEIPTGDATIFKVSGNLSRFFCAEAELTTNQYEKNLCRTQIILKLKENGEQICKEYFLKNPVGNHHIVFSGSHKDVFETFMSLLPTA